MSNRRSFIHKMGLLSASAITANMLQPAWSRNLQDALNNAASVSYTHLRAHETPEHLVCRLLLEQKKKNNTHNSSSHCS